MFRTRGTSILARFTGSTTMLPPSATMRRQRSWRGNARLIGSINICERRERLIRSQPPSGERSLDKGEGRNHKTGTLKNEKLRLNETTEAQRHRENAHKVCARFLCVSVPLWFRPISIFRSLGFPSCGFFLPAYGPGFSLTGG